MMVEFNRLLPAMPELGMGLPNDYQRNAGNLSVCGRYGRHNSIRLLYCKACKYRFSERKGTPLFQTHLPEPKARSVLQHLSEGCGVRQTGRLVDVHPNSVVRLAKKAGQHAHDAHDELVVTAQKLSASYERK
jgi:transposase-like protein